MWPLAVLLGIAAGAGGVLWAWSEKEKGIRAANAPLATGQANEIWTIELSGVPSNVGIDVLGNAIAQASGWTMDNIIDGGVVRSPDNDTGQIKAFLVAFKRPSPLPAVGLQFVIGSSIVTVTRVMRQPATVVGMRGFFP
jgi:hypothetical protein